MAQRQLIGHSGAELLFALWQRLQSRALRWVGRGPHDRNTAAVLLQARALWLKRLQLRLLQIQSGWQRQAVHHLLVAGVPSGGYLLAIRGLGAQLHSILKSENFVVVSGQFHGLHQADCGLERTPGRLSRLVGLGREIAVSAAIAGQNVQEGVLGFDFGRWIRCDDPFVALVEAVGTVFIWIEGVIGSVVLSIDSAVGPFGLLRFAVHSIIHLAVQVIQIRFVIVLIKVINIIEKVVVQLVVAVVAAGASSVEVRLASGCRWIDSRPASRSFFLLYCVGRRRQQCQEEAALVVD
mmetsp:Transcript_24836/g.34066  ORF Transcript_24836/g.34066 Transcript_24836/m.34066 type:complete len:294 (-) Transcript_24836:3045-3926(-)